MGSPVSPIVANLYMKSFELLTLLGYGKDMGMTLFSAIMERRIHATH